MKLKRGVRLKGISIRALALALSFIIGIALYSVWNGAPFRTRPATLKATITDAIEMLEQKDYKTFLKRYPDPQDVSEIVVRSVERNSYDTIEGAFDDERATLLLNALRHIKDEEPLYNEDKSEARFTLDEMIFHHDSITFRRIDNIWYIRDR